MEYSKLINTYTGRNVDPSEYNLISRDYGLTVEVMGWNITDKPQPTIAELEALQPQIETQENREKILAQIKELDGKRSRAFFEPSEKEPGQTWLEYYNYEIENLRSQIKII